MNPIYRFLIQNVTFKKGYIVTGTGAEQVNPQHGYNEQYLQVYGGSQFTINYIAPIGGCFYDYNKNPIGNGFSGVDFPDGVVTAPSGAYYVRVNWSLAMIENYTASLKLFGVEQIDNRIMKPTYKDDLAKDWELETNQRFYRAKLSGKISFLRSDYDYIAAKPFDTEFVLAIEKSNDAGQSWNPYHKTKFMKTDCEFDDDNKKCTVQPDTLDEYNEVLAGLEKEYNLIELAPSIEMCNMDKRPLIQIYIPGDTVVSCFLGGTYWEQDANAVNDRNALVSTYHFALCNLLKEINVTTNGSPNVNGLYSGRMTIVNNNEFTGNLYPDVTNGYYIRASQVYKPPFFGIIKYEFVRSADNVVVYRYTGTSSGNQLWDNADFDAPAVAGSGATGSAHCEMATYSIYARYLLDVETISGLDTYPIPTDDIVENNRNYTRAIGYAIDVAFVSNRSSTVPTEWGKRDDNTYFLPPYSIYGQNFFPIARSTWRYASIWFGFSLFDWILEEAGRKSYTLRDSNPLSSVISVLLKQFAPDITHEATAEYSQFLYGATNPIGYRQFTLLLTQKTNVKYGYYDRPAQKAPITLQQVTNMLRDCFRAFWYIEDGKFKVEHIVWFKNGGTYGSPTIGTDLTALENIRNGKKWGFASSKWTFDKPDMPERYKFAWMDDVTKAFEGFPIQVVSKYVTAGKIEDINVSQFTTDVDFVMLNPGSISDDGFMLFAAISNSIVNINASDVELGMHLLGDGTTTPASNYNTTGYTAVTAGTTYAITNMRIICWYDANKTFISAFDPVSNEAQIVTAPTGAAYCRITVLLPYWDTFYMNVGNRTIRYKLPYTQTDVGSLELISQNGYMSWIYLQPTFWVYDLPAVSVIINEAQEYARGIERKKKQTVNFPSIDDPDPMQLIKTPMGMGQIEKISVNLCSRMNKTTVKYDTE